MLRRMMPGGLPSNSRARNLREAHSSIWSRNRRNCSSRSFGAVRVTCSRLSIADVLTAQGMSFVPSVMENRNTMRSNSKPLMLPRSSVIYLAFSRAPSLYSSSLRWLRINLRDFAKAVGLGSMRARNKGSADLCRIPARNDAEAKRLFSLHVAGREILHGMLSIRTFDSVLNEG